MLRKRLVLVFSASLLILPLMWTSAPVAKTATVQDTVVWKLTGTSVVDFGRTVDVPADPLTGFPGGTLTTGYTLEARAKSKNGKLVPEGTFRLTLSAFQPSKDMPGQKAGLWHVEGNWTIVDKNADRTALKVRHNPYRVEGKIHAALPFNPASSKTNWTAEATVPMSPAAGQWAKGSRGSLTFDGRLEGDLFLVLKLWPNNQRLRRKDHETSLP